MASLYDISGQYAVVLNAIEMADTPEEAQELLDELAAIGDDLDNKAEQYIRIIKVKEAGGRCKITTKYTTAQKETKIIVNSPWVKEHCLFKDDSVIKNDKEYRRFMQFLCGWTMAGKNKHDDVPDALAMFADWQMSDKVNKVVIKKRMF